MVGFIKKNINEDFDLALRTSILKQFCASKQVGLLGVI